LGENNGRPSASSAKTRGESLERAPVFTFSEEDLLPEFLRQPLSLSYSASSSHFIGTFDGRPSVRSVISFAARTSPRTALRTRAAAILSALVRPSLSSGHSLSISTCKAAVNSSRRGLPAGFPLVPFGHGFRFCGFAISPFSHCFLTVKQQLPQLRAITFLRACRQR